MKLAAHVSGIGVAGPGITGLSVLAGGWQPAATVVPAPQCLPATERRRAGPVVKLAVAVAEQACAEAGLDPAGLATVFTSATGEPSNCHALCEALAAPERLVSPTRFTNSVHNAPAGYWHIAVKARAPSTSLAAWDASFGAGLLEAMAQCTQGRCPVLLVAADVPYPEPLHAKRPLPDAFGVALVLTPAGPGPRLTLSTTAAAPTPCLHAALDAQRRAIPAARSLPLLMALAGAAPAGCVIEAWDGLSLALEVAR